MASDFGSTSAKRAKLSLPEPLDPSEKELRQKSPTKHALENGNITEPSGNIGKKSRTHSPKSASNSPKGNITSPKGGVESPKSVTVSLKNNGVTSPKGNTPSPKGGDTVSPKAKSPKSAPVSPRGSLLGPKSGLQKPRSRSQSPKGRPQSPKGSPASQKLKKIVGISNNNHDGIYDTLHVDVDLANNKLMVSPIGGRRCHSDSRISVTSSIQPSDNKKRKLEFTEIKNKRSPPPGKKRRSDNTGNSSVPVSPAKPVDRTVDHNQNVQVVAVKRRNSWDNSLHSPDQYKSIHSIGSRKAVMKVATYSDTILTSTRRSLPACQPAITTNGTVDKAGGVQIAPMDLSVVKDYSALSKQVKVKSAVSKPQRTGMVSSKSETVSSKPEIVVTGESETSSIDSDPADKYDKYEKVDADILFKKEAIKRMETQRMEQEINSTGDKERSTPSSEVFDDASDKDKRSMTPQSEGDNSVFSTDDAPSTEGDQNQAKGKKQKRVAKKYIDIQPREPRKRRMASLTAETKNLLLFDKLITAPLPPVKKSTGEGRGRKRKREESQTSQSEVTDGALLQTCNHVTPTEIPIVAVEQSEVKDIVSRYNKAVTSLPTVKTAVDCAKNSRLNKDVKGGRTQTGNIKSPTGNMKSSTGNTKSLTGNMKSPTGNTKSLTGNMKSPTGNIKFSTGNMKSPTGNIKSPTGNIKFSTGNMKSPTGNPKSPTGNIKFPTGNPKSPTGNIKFPTGNMKSQTGNLKSPTGNIKSPTRTQPVKAKSPSSTASKPAGNSKAKPNVPKSNVSFAVVKKDKRKDSNSSSVAVVKKEKRKNSNSSSFAVVKKDKQKDSNTSRSKSPSPTVVKPSLSSTGKLVSLPADNSVSSPAVSSSPSKLLLSSRRTTVDTEDNEKLTAITSTTSITTPLLLRMSRHSTDGTSSGDESLLPSPSGFDPLSISLLQPGEGACEVVWQRWRRTGGILSGNFNANSASSNHYIPKSRVVKKIIKPTNLNSKIGKRHSTNGWKVMGEPIAKPIVLLNEAIREVRLCYQSIKRKEDVIQVRDCVMLRAGVKRKDLPFVAKVSALWEDPESGEIMMSLLWYYRPEHTEAGRRPSHSTNELFACRHWDINSVACIEDKCYVLTPAEYTRYCAFLQMRRENYVRSIPVVPEDPNGYPRQHRLPQNKIDPMSVFLCRQVYDFRQKRVLKNPY